MKIEAMIRKIVRTAVRKRDINYLKRELKKLFGSQKGHQSRQAKLEQDKLMQESIKRYQWLTNFTMISSEADEVKKQFKIILENIATIGGKINRELLNKVSEAISQDKTFREIHEITEGIIGKYRYYAKTITETALSGFDTTAMLIEAEKSGIDKFKYVGPPAQRPFCIKLLAESKAGKTWTRAEIEAMDNGQGLPVMYYKGGYNCKHSWVQVK